MIRAAPVSAALLAAGCVASLAAPPPARAQEAARADALARARELLRAHPLADTHNDLAYAISHHRGGDPYAVDLTVRQPELPADIPRLREGGVGIQVWSAYVAVDSIPLGSALRHAQRSIDVVHQFVERYPETFEMAASADDIERIDREGKIASLIGFEGGHAIENSMGALRNFRRLGVRYLTLTHFATTDWADAATDHPFHAGLTEYGEEVVRELNRLGIFVDLSHVSAETMLDALRVSRAPVLFSHSSARALNPHTRNVPDDVLRRLPDNGGVVMVNFIADYVSPEAPAWQAARDSAAEAARAMSDDPEAIARRLERWAEANPKPRGTIADVADHIDHIVEVAGIDHVGIGSDFYLGEPLAPDAMVEGLEGPEDYPALFAELLRRGHTEEALAKIARGNFVRAFRRMEEVSAELRASERPRPERLGPLPWP